VPSLAHKTVPINSATHPRPWLGAAGVLWAVGTLAWFLVSDGYPLSDAVQTFGIAVILTSLGIIGAAAMSRAQSVSTALAQLKLGPWIAIGFSIGFGLATLVWLRGDIEGYHGFVTQSTLYIGGIVAGTGFISLTFGYRFAPRFFCQGVSNADSHLRGNGAFASGARSVWALWTVSVAAQAISIARGSFGYLSDPSAALSTTSSSNAVLSALSQLGLLCTVIAAWRVAANRSPGALGLLVWVAGTQLVLGILSGLKEAAIVQLVAIVVGYSCRSKLRLRLLVVGALIAVFIVTPFVTAYRAAVVNGTSRLSPAQVLTEVQFGALFSSSAASNTSGNSLNAAEDRLSRIGDVSIIAEKTPSTIPYKSSMELLSGPILGLIPRSIWPGKPVLDAGYQTNTEYYGAAASIHSSAAVTPYGDLYRRGGIVVVIVGMAVLGMFVRAVDDREGASPRLDPRLMFLPMLLFATLVKQEMDYLGLSATIVSVVLSAAFGARLASRRAQR